MAASVKVNLGKNSSRIVIGEGCLSRLGKTCAALLPERSAFIVSNPTVWALHGTLLVKSLKMGRIGFRVCLVKDTEQSKSLHTAGTLLEEMASFSRDRKVFVLAFGGGVIGDLAGFCAAVFKRGTPCVQVPTTLLAQVDAAIGGKTAVDLPQAKNMVGTFHQPKLVCSDTRLLGTLSRAQIRNGMAEVIKYACISDPALMKLLEKEPHKMLSLDPKILSAVILRCSRIKASLVSKDEREEKGLRTILNFGHTCGHAVEAASGYSRYLHGDAVALGMRVACTISRSYGLPQKDILRIEALLDTYGLPRTIKGVRFPALEDAMSLDKKFSGPTNVWVLLRRIGRPAVVKNVGKETIRRAITARME